MPPPKKASHRQNTSSDDKPHAIPQSELDSHTEMQEAETTGPSPNEQADPTTKTEESAGVNAANPQRADVDAEQGETAASAAGEKAVNGTEKGEEKAPKKKGRKRKDDPSSSKGGDEPRKAPRRSGRGAATAQAQSQSSIDPIKMLRFLLSDEAAALCRPADEVEDIARHQQAGVKHPRTYSSSDFTPFEELLCAVILSRPISHRLGMRSIRTIFNPPYDFSSPKRIRDAGEEQRHQALWDAKTQHKAKTAEQIGLVADVVAERFIEGGNEDDTSLERVRKEADYDVEKEREILQTNIKGLGKTGLDIFFRRVQATWTSAYPFADPRTVSSIEKLGLPASAEALRDLIGERWQDLGEAVKGFKGAGMDEKKKRVFVRILEVAVGCDLEAKVDEARSAAEKR
ncbi:MAG: hypothetical protein M1817_004928 [Caeruleum heppii]|nr:MAG: hypothetical protein M1817_004928 [Caeruleum heppii]